SLQGPRYRVRHRVSRLAAHAGGVSVHRLRLVGGGRGGFRSDMSRRLLQRQKHRESPAQVSDFIIASEVLFHIVDDGQWISALKNIRTGMHDASVFMFTETFVKSIEAGPSHFKPRTRAMYAAALQDQELR